MNAPVKELQALATLREQCRGFLEEGRLEEAAVAAQQMLRLDENRPRTYELMAEIAGRKGDDAGAASLRARAAALRKEAWQRKVEAELRSRHEVMGEAIKHEMP
jgi:two-component SAPR family response regulator